ncbi:hypothetical protein EC973_006783 [Apophysomyces ossiformis]|uniref:Uncharacterized protein n=1 Tax=Apophysomyces ossiformis TaxID=679940 RepID=A0A8H7BN29_9FUNG|nr:hypothetical protein EC973_006783 [Apophysomyces ossiformis]
MASVVHRLLFHWTRTHFLVVLLLLCTLITTLFYLPESPKVLSSESAVVKQITIPIDPPTWPAQLSMKHQSMYTPSMFFPEQLELNRYKPVTAIIRRVSNDHGIYHVVEHLRKYPFVKEIIIDNQVPQASLSPEQFTADVQIYSGSLQTMGRYSACAAAAFDSCYFQDDGWLNSYLDSTYTHFLRYPDTIVTHTTPQNYIDQLHRRFGHKAWYMHTGYGDVKYGTFVPRSTVQQFLEQLAHQNMNNTTLLLADIYFTLWSNEYPWLLSNPLLPFKDDELKTQLTQHALDRYVYDAVHRLAQALKDGDIAFNRTEAEPILETRDVRSSCSNDRCLFTTNIDPFPLPESIQFNLENMTSIIQLESYYDELDVPTKEMQHRAYHKAVDQDAGSCWNTYISPQAGDYFGLNMIGTIHAKRLVIYARQKGLNATMFSVSVQEKEEWINCNPKDSRTLSRNQHRLALDLNCPNVQAFRAIRISFTKDQLEAFDLCGLSLDNFMV